MLVQVRDAGCDARQLRDAGFRRSPGRSSARHPEESVRHPLRTVVIGMSVPYSTTFLPNTKAEEGIVANAKSISKMRLTKNPSTRGLPSRVEDLIVADASQNWYG